MDKMNRKEAGSSDYHIEQGYESPLKSVIWAVRRSRGIFLVGTGLITILVLAISSLIYLNRVNEDVTELEFMLHFEGIENNRYPDGLAFSPSDIIAPNILYQVYQANKLDRYIDYDQFQTTLSIFQRNDQVVLLEKEYLGILSDKTLKPPDRKRIEDEFMSKKSKLFTPIYKLVFTSTAGLKSVPIELRAKILTNILRFWAEYIINKKMVDRYQIDLVSDNILSAEEIEPEDYFCSNDILRLTIKRVQENITVIARLPGAKLIKVGPRGISLQDLAYRLEDIQRFKLSPLVGLIRQSGISKNRQQTLSYLENRIFSLNLGKENSSARKKVYEDSFNQYVEKARNYPAGTGRVNINSSASSPPPGNIPALIPQFGESFLNSLMNLGQEGSDTQYRQNITDQIIQSGLSEVGIEYELKYYQEMHEAMKKPSKDFSVEVLDTIRKNISEGHKYIYEQIHKSITELNLIFSEVCNNNLNPGSQIYTITQPVSFDRLSSITLKKLILYAILTWIILEFLIISWVYWRSISFPD